MSARLRRSWWGAGLLLAALVVIVLAPFASSDPDGLERVAIDLGFIDAGQDAGYQILPDYTVPGIADETLSLVAAGLLGVAILFGLTWVLGRLLARRPHTSD